MPDKEKTIPISEVEQYITQACQDFIEKVIPEVKQIQSPYNLGYNQAIADMRANMRGNDERQTS